MTDEQQVEEQTEEAPAAPAGYLFAFEVTASAEVIKADGTVRD